LRESAGYTPQRISAHLCAQAGRALRITPGLQTPTPPVNLRPDAERCRRIKPRTINIRLAKIAGERTRSIPNRNLGRQYEKEDSIMLDINKATTTPRDPEGNMYGLEPWSPLTAHRQAEAEGLFLTDEHWEIVIYLRERYRERGGAGSAREVLKELEARFSDGHGRRSLYELFPGGPVGQASRIAGLPLPPYSSDPSFGSAE
jgi:tRNA 2-thiouridine synthesizing protein E